MGDELAAVAFWVDPFGGRNPWRVEPVDIHMTSNGQDG